MNKEAVIGFNILGFIFFTLGIGEPLYEIIVWLLFSWIAANLLNYMTPGKWFDFTLTPITTLVGFVVGYKLHPFLPDKLEPLIWAALFGAVSLEVIRVFGQIIMFVRALLSSATDRAPDIVKSAIKRVGGGG